MFPRSASRTTETTEVSEANVDRLYMIIEPVDTIFFFINRINE
jgi:hypothetical protein